MLRQLVYNGGPRDVIRLILASGEELIEIVSGLCGEDVDSRELC